MYLKRILPITVLAVVTIALPALVAAPMGSVVTYQGQLQQFSPGGGIGQLPSFGRSRASVISGSASGMPSPTAIS